MDWELGTSTFIYEGSFGIKQLEILEKAGINYFELISWPPRFDWDNKRLIEEVKRYLKSSNLKCWSVHTIFGGENDFSLFTGKEQDSSLSQIKKSMELAATLGVDKAVVHPSGEPITQAERAKRLFQSKEGLNKLVDFAKGLKLKLAVENLNLRALGNSSQEMQEIVSDFDREVLEVCLDVNHIFKERIDEFIKSIGDRIITLHISDNDGADERHWLPMKGVIDWADLLSTLKNIGYSGVFMYEAQPEVEGFEKRIEAIKENYRELKQLL